MEESPCWYFSWWRMSTVLATGGLAPSSCVGKTLSSGGEIFGQARGRVHFEGLT